MIGVVQAAGDEIAGAADAGAEVGGVPFTSGSLSIGAWRIFAETLSATARGLARKIGNDRRQVTDSALGIDDSAASPPPCGPMADRASWHQALLCFRSRNGQHDGSCVGISSRARRRAKTDLKPLIPRATRRLWKSVPQTHSQTLSMLHPRDEGVIHGISALQIQFLNRITERRRNRMAPIPRRSAANDMGSRDSTTAGSSCAAPIVCADGFRGARREAGFCRPCSVFGAPRPRRSTHRLTHPSSNAPPSLQKAPAIAAENAEHGPAPADPTHVRRPKARHRGHAAGPAAFPYQALSNPRQSRLRLTKT